MYACMCVFAYTCMDTTVCVGLNARVLAPVCVCYERVASQQSPRGAPALLSSPHNLTKTLISPPMMDAYGFLRR